MRSSRGSADAMFLLKASCDLGSSIHDATIHGETVPRATVRSRHFIARLLSSRHFAAMLLTAETFHSHDK